ncbi:MAG: DUF3179 domain-containing protein [Halobacteria archaeon]
MKLTRRKYLALASAGLASGCLGGNGGSSGDTGTTAGTSVKGGKNSGGPPTEKFDNPSKYGLSRFNGEAVDVLGKDNIPAVDEPKFVSADSVEFLHPNDIVFGVEIDGESKAYPRKILSHHEIANDTVGGNDVSITYCPLTGTAIGYYRGDTTFGVSGDLVNSNLIMYDRATDTFWPQILGAGVNGDLTGRGLEEFRVVWTTWSEWKEVHPNTEVMSTETGYFRDYENDPYGRYNPKGGYYTSDSLLYGPIQADDRFPPKKVFMGARNSDGAIAFDKEKLRNEKVMTGKPSSGDTPYSAFYDAGLDTSWVYRDPDRKYTGSGDPPDDPSDLDLESVNSFDAMWFAWSGFYPKTTVVT